uniref:Uncharacterized protein n=1 Tax=Nicotiana tabacum TaxID=4097 RepID=A0A1S4CK73_TOBAC|nr:PREDICTED: uncharacterized protein LOC107819774 [Nicotiana tabacum]
MENQELGDAYSDVLADQEKNYLIQLEKWSLIEESALQQKSKVTWIKQGDSNTKYFSAVMKEKQQKKQITEIKSLLGLELCAPITEEEINEGLSSIGDDKAPGIDGFNVVFFKQTLSIIKNEVCETVQDFFITGTLYKAINCTALTLVPKVPNPDTVKDYSSILAVQCYTRLLLRSSPADYRK